MSYSQTEADLLRENAELRESLKFAQLERDNRTSAYEVGVKTIAELRASDARMREALEKANCKCKYDSVFCNDCGDKCVGWKCPKHGPRSLGQATARMANKCYRCLALAQVPVRLLEEITAPLEARIAELEGALSGLYMEIAKYQLIAHEGSNLLEVMSDARKALARTPVESLEAIQAAARAEGDSK